MSAWTATARPPRASTSRRTCSISPAERAITATLAPSWANVVAMARPMPRPPPVTIAVRPSLRGLSSSMLAHLLAQRGDRRARLPALLDDVHLPGALVQLLHRCPDVVRVDLVDRQEGVR